jgi:hypothetical protein
LDAPWTAAIELLKPHVVRVSTPSGSGTGFLIGNGKNNSLCAIATAAHVVADAHWWEQPIRLDHPHSGQSVLLRRDNRAIFLDQQHDTAAVFCDRGGMELPAEPLPMVPVDKCLKVASRVGWLGFPAIMPSDMCFFVGVVSAWIQDQLAYLVDGVAINGVSGGPVFFLPDGGEPALVVAGVVAAYLPNVATGTVLPGLSLVRDVSQFHRLAPTFASLDQAQDAEPPAERPLGRPEADQGQQATRSI